jgi:hypothetical protein
MADALAGARHHLDQQAQLPGDVAVLALLLDEVLGQADALAHVNVLQVDSCCSRDARLTISGAVTTSLVGSGRLGGHAGNRLARGAAVGLGELAPAVSARAGGRRAAG